MAQHNELGKQGEAIAREILTKKGYHILETNWRHEHDEIDIIARDASELVIVEVKTRSSAYFGYPESAVDFKKEAFLIRATEAYVEDKNWMGEVRYDVVSIVLNDKEASVHHIEDAFFPE